MKGRRHVDEDDLVDTSALDSEGPEAWPRDRAAGTSAIGGRKLRPLDPSRPAPLCLRAEQVAYALQISRASVYELLEDHTIPSVRIGRRRLVRWSDLEAYVNGLETTQGHGLRLLRGR